MHCLYCVFVAGCFLACDWLWHRTGVRMDNSMRSLCYRFGSRVATSRLAAVGLLLCVTWVFSVFLVSENPSWTDALPRENYSNDMEWAMAERKARYEKVCSARAVPGEVNKVYYHKDKGLAVCHVPKVGCTFWKQVFHFLYDETEGKRVQSPFEIDRFYVHFAPKKRVKVISSYSSRWFYSWEKSVVDSLNKALFVRDPYARLWSVYVDKFVLPDSWLGYGEAMLRLRRKMSNSASKTCPDDITFPEFISFVLKTPSDEHWMPVHKLCNPCVFQPQYVGKMETFSRDTSYLLNASGLSHLVQGHKDFKQHMVDEIRMLTKYTFQIYLARKKLRDCMHHHSDVVRRLWMAFILNGYIDGNVALPVEEVSSELDRLPTEKAADRALAILLGAHSEGPAMSSAEMKAHRRRLMAQNYRAVPPQLLDKLMYTFADEFELFDYDPRPADIYGYSPTIGG